jgi:hypothetical protein
LTATRDDQRTDDKQRHEYRGDPEQRHQRAETVSKQHLLTERDVELILDLRGVKKEGPIVGRRPDVGRDRTHRTARGRPP